MFKLNTVNKILIVILGGLAHQVIAIPTWNVVIKNTTSRPAILTLAKEQCFKMSEDGNTIQIDPGKSHTIKVEEQLVGDFCLHVNHYANYTINLAGSIKPYTVNLENIWQIVPFPRYRQMSLDGRNIVNPANSDFAAQNINIDIYQDLCKHDKNKTRYLQCLVKE